VQGWNSIDSQVSGQDQSDLPPMQPTSDGRIFGTAEPRYRQLQVGTARATQPEKP
jgi:hypothetical protein